MFFAPYRGSLLKLAFAFIAFTAVAAAAWTFWQESTARHARREVPTQSDVTAMIR